MNCPHCHTTIQTPPPFDRSLEDGRAFAQCCPRCGHVIAIRSRVAADPPLMPAGLDAAQTARLNFVRWRLERQAERGIMRHAAKPRLQLPPPPAADGNMGGTVLT